MKILTLTLLLGLASCSFNQEKRVDGTQRISAQFFAQGGAIYNADGSAQMWGNADKAAEEAGKLGSLSIKAGVVGQGIGALQKVGTGAINKFSN
jgi:hypothetical protein